MPADRRHRDHENTALRPCDLRGEPQQPVCGPRLAHIYYRRSTTTSTTTTTTTTTTTKLNHHRTRCSCSTPSPVSSGSSSRASRCDAPSSGSAPTKIESIHVFRIVQVSLLACMLVEHVNEACTGLHLFHQLDVMSFVCIHKLFTQIITHGNYASAVHSHANMLYATACRFAGSNKPHSFKLLSFDTMVWQSACYMPSRKSRRCVRC